ncbi:Protein of unknown function (DUF2948) [Yoonia maritima]|uniref:DUF2948 family protein n=1 Tax=Yoonia maritima TaxID=1435347 RepID=A0A2T0W0B1_9RHOB|nr:DUF2948 family protein [Yoonia maritima]PRY78262.1 Protein of unknown function (DUF2948) [Yoonia maritima]
MTEDARFEDGKEAPLRLKALDADDLTVIAALVQDAVFPASEMRWDRKARRFALLLNRYRWEDAENSVRHGHERVQAVLAFEDVMRVQSQGVDKSDPEMVFSLLSISFTPGEDGAGRVELTLAGDGAIAFEVEALEVILRDVTRPYVAPSGKAPTHPE